MAEEKVLLLKAFGEEDFFRTAFNYDLDKIKKWMEDCLVGNAGGDQTKKPEVQKQLKDVKDKLDRLILPKGEDFIKKELAPKSHFLRVLNTEWSASAKDYMAKFELGYWPINYQGVLERSISVRWWNPYDLLGLFISILGPAPGTANRNNYFKPLTAVYARWCSRIAGYARKWKPPGDGAGDWPYMFQVTWKLVGDKNYFFLGSSIAGDNWKTSEVGQWIKEVQRQRFYMLHDSLLRVDLFKRDFNKTPVKLDTNTLANHSFGNCGETYPFIFSVRGTRDNNRTLEGLALSRNFMMSQSLDSYDTYLKAKNTNLSGPCGNCKQLISRAGALKRNFSRYRGASSTAKKTQGTTTQEIAATTTQMAAITDPPEGWSVNLDDLDRDYYWGPDGDGTVAAQRVGLTGMKELMIVDPDNGSDSYMFTASTGKIYLWYMVTGEIFEYTNPSDQAGILAEMKKPAGTGKLERTLLPQV
ncbi:hypothetical protein F5Y00DRAFT_273075 [Daldinia vernicosa]|uniref:uncharacterized protein n=1 Tax=Daldinia vernicosa TaxID=114800 RepID=UPI002008DE46|nr:uncharacterized protein F5Y00DRAFT_273075 [Daldinia vernicosa]KAI0852451.1 hypothetical protein F5Y00DRAFT_273075 [Daldinia vernicosa]